MTTFNDAIQCYFSDDHDIKNERDPKQITWLSTDMQIGDMINYNLTMKLSVQGRFLVVDCDGKRMADQKFESLADITLDSFADLTTIALQNLSTTHKCKKCASPIDFHKKRTHVNGICRDCIRDYTKYKSKWGLTSVEQYKNAECPITQEKLQLGSTFITDCCKTGIEWDAFNEYCKRKLEESDDNHFRIKCPMCRAKNRKFLPGWSNWYACHTAYDWEDSDSELEEEIANANLTAVGTALVEAIMNESIIHTQEEYEAESRENESRLQELDFPLINPGESLSEFQARIERENPQ